MKSGDYEDKDAENEIQREETDEKRNEQRMRAEMMIRYLKLMYYLCGKEVSLEMYHNTKVSGKFGAMRADQTHYIIESLQTPIGVVRSAILRMGDTLSITTEHTQDCDKFRIKPFESSKQVTDSTND